MKVVIIGGGAAGFFAAISCKSHSPDAHVVVYEKSKQLLSKVKISGGGRCNVTNACESNADFLKHYPRGQKQLKKTFNHFNRKDTIDWFQGRGVTLKKEPDGRMFPVTDDSQTIIDCLQKEVHQLGVMVNCGQGVEKISSGLNCFEMSIKNTPDIRAEYVIVTTGGSPQRRGYDWLDQLGHGIVAPVPSLFTFNIEKETKLKKMMGVVVPKAIVKIQGTKLTQQGSVLITHWGLSGPAILKLSAWGARQLSEMQYEFSVLVNWVGVGNEQILREQLEKEATAHAKKKLSNANFCDIPHRLWVYLIDRAGLNDQQTWSEVKKKDKNRLINLLVNDAYTVKGKTTFKEEFVICGGVDRAEIDFNTMASRKVANLFFAGEVLDIDGVTGGFNFQAAWSTGFVAGKLGEGTFFYQNPLVYS